MNKKKMKIAVVAISIIVMAIFVVQYGAYKNSKLKEASKQVSNEVPNKTGQNQTQVVDNTTKKSDDSKLDSKAATELISKFVKASYPEAKCVYDHNQKRDGKEYYVIHAFGMMPDNSSTATIGWYYVEIETGKAFEWDLANDKLNPINLK